MASVDGVIKSARTIMRQDTGTASDELRILQLGWMIFLKVLCEKEQELELLDDSYVPSVPSQLSWTTWASDREGLTGQELIDFVDRTLFPDLASINSASNPGRAALVREVFSNSFNYMKSGIHLRQVINKLNEIDFNRSKDKQVFGVIYEKFLAGLQSAGTLGEFYTPRGVTRFMAEMVDPALGQKVLDPACGTGGFLVEVVELLKEKSTSVKEREALSDDVVGWEYKPLPYLLANTNLILHDINLPRIKSQDSLARPLVDYTEKDRVDVVLANPPFGGVVSNNNEKNFPSDLRSKESADLFLLIILRVLKVGGKAAIVLPDGSLSGDGVKARIRKKLLKECNVHTIIRLPNSVFKPYATVATNIVFLEKGEPTKHIWFYEHKCPPGLKSYSKTRPIQYEEFSAIRAWWDERSISESAWMLSAEEIRRRSYDLDVKNPSARSERPQFNVTEYIHRLREDLSEVNSDIDSIFQSIVPQSGGTPVPLGEVCDITKGKTGIKKAIAGDYPLVTTAEDRSTHNSYQFDCEAVCIPLVSSTGHGHASIKRIHYQAGRFALGSILAAVTPKDPETLSARYLFYYLSTFKDEVLVSLMKGMANVSLTVGKLETVPIFVPAPAKQRELIALMDKCQELRNTLNSSNLHAEEMIKAAFLNAFPESARFETQEI